MRYAERIGAKQSSAGSVTYVSADCGTGLLRTYTALYVKPCGASQRRRTAPGR
ncbi:MAG: hypothetical protein LBM98_11085 [Oscillospiraceae bacterium]|nr:hypothetical protein [Oscillospiraceae bacterium]